MNKYMYIYIEREGADKDIYSDTDVENHWYWDVTRISEHMTSTDGKTLSVVVVWGLKVDVVVIIMTGIQKFINTEWHVYASMTQITIGSDNVLLLVEAKFLVCQTETDTPWSPFGRRHFEMHFCLKIAFASKCHWNLFPGDQLTISHHWFI